MQQDYIKKFVMKESNTDDEEYGSLSLLWDIRDWWYCLERDIRSRTPLPGSSYYFPPFIIITIKIHVVHVPDGESAYETGVIWFRTRLTADEGIESVSEIEADKIVKRRFLKAIGRDFDENQLVFFAKATS